VTERIIRPQQRNPSWGLYHDHVEDFAYWDGAFTPEECEQVTQLAKEYTPNLGTILSDKDGFTGDKSIRDCGVAFLSPDHMEWFYQKLSYYIHELNNRYFRFDLFGLSENLQFTQYVAPTGKYDSHIDKAFGAQIRKLSIVVQMSKPEDYEGGDLQILTSGEEKPRNVKRDLGTLVAFPSYTLHRVTPVTKGVRNSLVGWVTGAPFK
jgi:PKHD-type hydroxylase